MKVRDLLRLLAKDGWVIVATKGSHRQLKHQKKVGRVTVAIGFHIAGLREDGLPVPKPSARPHAVAIPGTRARATSRPRREDWSRKRPAPAAARRRPLAR